MKPLLSKRSMENVVFISLDSPKKEKVWENYIYKNKLAGTYILANNFLKN